MEHKQALPYVTGAGIKPTPHPHPQRYGLGYYVAQLLEWYKRKGIVYVISLFNNNCVSLCRYIYLARTIFSWLS